MQDLLKEVSTAETMFLKDYADSFKPSMGESTMGAELVFTLPADFLSVERRVKGMGIGGVCLWASPSIAEHAVLLLCDILFKTKDRFNLDHSSIELFIDAEYIHALHEERTKNAVLTTMDLNALYHHLFDIFTEAVFALYKAWDVLHAMPFAEGCYVKCNDRQGDNVSIQFYANTQPVTGVHTPRESINVDESTQLSDS